MAKKTLAEQIAELSKPEVSDFDIEDSERAIFEHSASGSEEDEEDEVLKSEHYVKVGKSKLRDNGIHLRDAKYIGKASSRKDIFEDSEHELNVESSEISEEDEEDEGGSHSEDSGDEAQEYKALESKSDSESEQIEGDEAQEYKALESKSDSESEQIEEQFDPLSLTNSSDEYNSDSEPSTEEEITDSKRQKLKQFMANERKHIISRLSASTKIDALKGFAVISQQNTFDKIIDTRIKVQKALSSANSLPLNKETFEEFVESDTKSLLEAAEEDVMALLDTILQLRTKIYNKEKITKDILTYRSKKRSFGEYFSETEKLDGFLNKHRDSVLTKWSHKVQSASGAQALSTSKFKALNQSAAQQVEVNLMDMDRLLKRTKLNRRNVVPLGRTESEEEEVKMDRSLKEDNDIFDDEDFYRVLLNDLVDKKISESNPTSGLVITKTKVKKNVDTKASKGRKLKFTVQDQIQNYEAPKGDFKWDNEQIDEFFAGLLGQRVDFAENSDQESEIEEDNEEVKNDDLRVFG
jgi:protein AATF/BFR2